MHVSIFPNNFVIFRFIFEQNNWYLYDGEINKEKSYHISSNGLWRLITESTRLIDFMTFKVGNTTLTTLLECR